MPKIQEYQSRVQPAGAANNLRYGESSSSVNAGLASIGKGVSDLSEGLKQYSDKKENFETQKALSSEQQYWITKLEDAKQNSDQYLDDKGNSTFLQKFNEEFESRQSKGLQDGGYNSQKYELGMAALRNSLTDNAHAIEAGIYAKQTSRFLSSTVDTNENLVRSNPSKLNEILASQQSLIDAYPHFKSDEVRKTALEQSYKRLQGAALDGEVVGLATSTSATAADVDKKLNSLPLRAKDLSDSDYKSAFSRLSQLKESLTSKNQQLLYKDFDEKMDQLEDPDVDKDHGKYSAGWIKANVQDPVKQSLMLERESKSRAVFNQVSEMRGKPFSESYNKILELRKSKSDSPDYHKNKAVYQASVEAFTKMQSEFVKDQAGFLIKNSESVKAQWDVFAQNPDANNANIYADAVIAEKNRLSPGAPVTLLPDTAVSSFKEKMASISEGPSGVEDAVKALQSESAKWGKNWAVAAKDLRNGKALNDAQYVAAGMVTNPKSLGTMRDLIKASALSEKELTADLEGGDKKDAVERARSALSEFRDSLSDSNDRDQIYGAYETALTNLLIYQKKWPSSGSKKDADDLAKDMIASQYEFRGSYRIPVNQNPSLVEAGANNLKLKLGSRDIVPFSNSFEMSPEDLKSFTASRLQRSGRFATNRDETGLILLNEFGQQVMERKNGKLTPLQFTWDELRSASGSEPYEGDRF